MSQTLTGFNKNRTLRNQARTASQIGYNDDYTNSRNDTGMMNKTFAGGFKIHKK